MTAKKRGSLAVVGIGIRAPAQATLEASARIRYADKVYTLVANPLAEYWIQSLNVNAETLNDLYAVGKERRQTYREMVERIVGAVRENLRVCAVSYGRPGVFAYPFHAAVTQLRAEGFAAEMLAGVSAEDCLFAELGVDPAVAGCRSYEATDFLVYRRGTDPASALILWQIGVIAVAGYSHDEHAWNPEGLRVLTETLLETYRPAHEVIDYEAARLPVGESTIARIPLERLTEAPITPMSTLYVPPMCKPKVDAAMLRRLGMGPAPRGSPVPARTG
jgi:uncharacterized protein YabN with tetrapyrrole methylase and pyrophosphatase domain